MHDYILEERIVITCTDTTGAICSTAAVGRTRFTARMETTVCILSSADSSYTNRAYGGAGDDQIYAGSEIDLIDGGQGEDFVYYYYSTASVGVNLQTGLGSGGDAAGDTYRSIEDVYGSCYNDLLIGNGAFNEINGYSGDDVVRGGAGGDYLDGGDGVDTLDYRGSDAGVNVNLGNGGTFGGDAQGDQFLAFESIFGSDFNDTLAGDAAANRLFGNAGNDVCFGLDGNDTLAGNDGNDALYGGIGNDVCVGGAGADLLNGGLGTDQLYGGVNADRFQLSATTHSLPGAWDTVEDFVRAQADRLDPSRPSTRTPPRRATRPSSGGGPARSPVSTGSCSTSTSGRTSWCGGT